MPRESNDRSQEREDEGAQLSRAAQSDRESERAPERDKREHDEEQEEIEAELEDLQEMEGPDA